MARLFKYLHRGDHESERSFVRGGVKTRGKTILRLQKFGLFCFILSQGTEKIISSLQKKIPNTKRYVSDLGNQVDQLLFTTFIKVTSGLKAMHLKAY